MEDAVSRGKVDGVLQLRGRHKDGDKLSPLRAKSEVENNCETALAGIEDGGFSLSFTLILTEWPPRHCGRGRLHASSEYGSS
jgi:hypothetical protein